ncbi:MAG: hypothetical protein O2897_01800 [bacterium]|nr:hypothetical protein [bacterium]
MAEIPKIGSGIGAAQEASKILKQDQVKSSDSGKNFAKVLGKDKAQEAAQINKPASALQTDSAHMHRVAQSQKIDSSNIQVVNNKVNAKNEISPMRTILGKLEKDSTGMNNLMAGIMSGDQINPKQTLMMQMAVANIASTQAFVGKFVEIAVSDVKTIAGTQI